jgi:hypothetical protein
MKIAIALSIAAAALAPDVIAATPGETAFDQQTTAEYRAMGECLAGQMRTRGWVGHGPKNRIVIAAALSMVISPVMAAEADNADNPKGAQEFPIMDIDAACRRSNSMFTGNTFTTIIGTCMDSARTSLVLAKSDWERSPSQAKEKCLSASKITLGQVDFYDLLFSCLSDEITSNNLARHQWNILNNECRSGSNPADTDRICTEREKLGILLEQRGCTYIGYVGEGHYRCGE